MQFSLYTAANIRGVVAFLAPYLNITALNLMLYKYTL